MKTITRKNKKNTVTAYKAIILLLSLSKYQCQLVELAINTLLWASQYDKPVIMHNYQCHYQCQYLIGLSIIFSVHFQECSLLKTLGESVSLAGCQLPTDRKQNSDAVLEIFQLLLFFYYLTDSVFSVTVSVIFLFFSYSYS